MVRRFLKALLLIVIALVLSILVTPAITWSFVLCPIAFFLLMAIVAFGISTEHPLVGMIGMCAVLSATTLFVENPFSLDMVIILYLSYLYIFIILLSAVNKL